MLKPSTTTKLREAVTRNLPPRTFTVTNSDPPRLVEGYLQRVGGVVAVDDLGFRELDARIHLSSGVVSPGDELNDLYVIWEFDVSGTFTTYVARRIPAFREWVMWRREKVGVDHVTREPIYRRERNPVLMHLVRNAPSYLPDMSGTNQGGRAVGLVHPGTLAVGDDVQHDEYGTYSVLNVMNYGPWHRVSLGSV